MKRVVAAIGMCALLLAAGTAGASMLLTGFSWDTASGRWTVDDNWDSSDWPGYAGGDNADTATIDKVNKSAYTVTVDDAVTYDVNWVVVDAETAGADVTLKIDTNGDLDVLNSGNGYIQLIGGSQPVQPPVSYDAKLWYAAGTLDVDKLDFRGTTDDTGHAIANFEVSLTVGVSTEIRGYVDIDIADSTTFDADDLTMVAGSSADMQVTGHSSVGTSKLRMDSYTHNSQTISFVGPLVAEVY